MPDSAMARSYGKFRRRVASAPAAQIPQTVTAKLAGTNDLEQLSRLCEMLIARLQGEGVAAVQNVTLTFDPLTQEGAPMAIREEGKPVSLIRIWLPAAMRFAAVSF